MGPGRNQTNSQSQLPRQHSLSFPRWTGRWIISQYLRHAKEIRQLHISTPPSRPCQARRLIAWEMVLLFISPLDDLWTQKVRIIPDLRITVISSLNHFWWSGFYPFLHDTADVVLLCPFLQCILREKSICCQNHLVLSPRCENTVHHSGESMAAGAWGCSLHINRPGNTAEQDVRLSYKPQGLSPPSSS